MSEGGREQAGGLLRSLSGGHQWRLWSMSQIRLGIAISSTVDVPNSVKSLILIGHLQLSGVCVGATPRTHTKNTCELRRDWITYRRMK